jgi:hypothetical protein
MGFCVRGTRFQRVISAMRFKRMAGGAAGHHA